MGANYITSNAINQLEMFQADTFDPGRIDTELGWAQSNGFNAVRVFLHDLLWAAARRQRPTSRSAACARACLGESNPCQHMLPEET